MNLLPLAIVGGAALWFARREPGVRVANGEIVKGARYVAVYALPPRFPVQDETLAKLAAILPPDSSVERDGQKLVITMTAVSSERIGDIPTPFGTLKLVTLRRLSDVVGAIDPTTFGRTWYTMSGWFPREDGRGLKWSGWTAPVQMTFREANSYMLASPWKSARAYRWDGSRWVAS